MMEIKNGNDQMTTAFHHKKIQHNLLKIIKILTSTNAGRDWFTFGFQNFNKELLLCNWCVIN